MDSLKKKYTRSICQSKMPLLKHKSKFSNVSLLYKSDILRYLGQQRLGTTENIENISKRRPEHRRGSNIYIYIYIPLQRR